MHHNIFGKKLNRDTGQRQALLKGLAGALVRSEAIETTEAKAKAAVGMIEDLVTSAKRAHLNDIRKIEAVLTSKELVGKLVQDIAPRFKNRAGGYIRLIKLGNRVGDNAPMMRMEFTAAATTEAETPVVTTIEKKATATKTVAKKTVTAKKTTAKK